MATFLNRASYSTQKANKRGIDQGDPCILAGLIDRFSLIYQYVNLLDLRNDLLRDILFASYRLLLPS